MDSHVSFRYAGQNLQIEPGHAQHDQQHPTQQQQQQQPAVRSPAATVADEDAQRHDGAAVGSVYAAYRTAQLHASGQRPSYSPAPSASGTASWFGPPRATPTARMLTFVNSSPAPTPTAHATDQAAVKVLEKRWSNLYGAMKGNSQAAADVLMRQATATSQLEEMVGQLFTQLKAVVEDRSRLQAVLLQDRAGHVAAAEEAAALRQQVAAAEHRAATAQVVAEALQAQLSAAREALEGSTRERQQLEQRVKELGEQLEVTSECRQRGDALISEQAEALGSLQQQLQQQAAAAASLGADKASLEQQLQGVLAAERELTAHLRETHAAIEGQLTALRDQLQSERQKRAAVVKRRGELQAQVAALQAQLAEQQQRMEAMAEAMAAAAKQPASTSRSGARAPSPTPGVRPLAPSHSAQQTPATTSARQASPSPYRTAAVSSAVHVEASSSGATPVSNTTASARPSSASASAARVGQIRARTSLRPATAHSTPTTQPHAGAAANSRPASSPSPDRAVNTSSANAASTSGGGGGGGGGGGNGGAAAGTGVGAGSRGSSGGAPSARASSQGRDRVAGAALTAGARPGRHGERSPSPRRQQRVTSAGGRVGAARAAVGKPAGNAANAGLGPAVAEAGVAAAPAREAPGRTAWSVGHEEEQGPGPMFDKGSTALPGTSASPPSGGRYQYQEAPGAGLYGAGSPYSDGVLVGDDQMGDEEGLEAGDGGGAAGLEASHGLGLRHGEDTAATGVGTRAVKAVVPSSLSPHVPQAARPEVPSGAATLPLSHQQPHQNQYHQHQHQYDKVHPHPGSTASSTPAGTARRSANSRTAAPAAAFEPFSPPIHIPPLPYHDGDQGQEKEQATELSARQQQQQQGGSVLGNAALSRSEGGAGMGAGQWAAPGLGVTDQGVSERRRTAGSPEPGRTGANVARRLSLEHVRTAGQGVVGGRVASPSGVQHATHTWVP